MNERTRPHGTSRINKNQEESSYYSTSDTVGEPWETRTGALNAATFPATTRNVDKSTRSIGRELEMEMECTIVVRRHIHDNCHGTVFHNKDLSFVLVDVDYFLFLDYLV